MNQDVVILQVWQESLKGSTNCHVISRQLVCSLFYSFDQVPKAGLPSHRAPQPVLDESVEMTVLLHIIPQATPCLYQQGFFQGARASVMRGMGLEVSASTIGAAYEAGLAVAPEKQRP